MGCGRAAARPRRLLAAEAQEVAGVLHAVSCLTDLGGGLGEEAGAGGRPVRAPRLCKGWLACFTA